MSADETTEESGARFEAADGRPQATNDPRSGMSPRTVTALVAGLYAAGALENADVASVSPTEIAADDVAKAFVQSASGVTTSSPSWSEVALRFATTPVRVIGTGAAVDDLIAVLATCGIAAQRHGGPHGDAVDGLDVVVADDDRCSHEALTRISTDWQTTPGRRLVVGIEGNDIVLGPYLDPRFAACYACATERAGVRNWRRARSIDEARLLAATAATEIVALVARVTRPAVVRTVVRFHLDTWEQEQTLSAPVPGCPSCLFGDTGAFRSLDTPLVFDHATSSAPPGLVSPRDRALYDESNGLPLPPEREPHGDHPTYRLPDCPDPLTSSAGLDAGDIGAILCAMMGIRRGEGGRWSPTCAGSVHGYVLLPHALGSIPAGVHRYEPGRHCLAHLVPLVDGVEPLGDGDTLAIVVTVGGHLRLRPAYDDTALRMLYLDAGAAAASGVAVGARRGIRVEVIDGWPDEQLETLLAINRYEEPITGMVRIVDPIAEATA